ncbi:MAG: hypothetical protein FD170_3041 [Bacteroidetes bacterium]|nr:MAG: hypothetical protein FD170_3041 [Bacteroidota bacterium]
MKSKITAALLTFFIFSGFGFHASGQDLLDLLGEDEPVTNYTYATFKTTRIINGHSIENPADGVLLFMISHRFGKLNSGAYDFFGLDQATIRLGFEYGIGDRLSVGIGRSSYQKSFDGFLKFKLLRQSSGEKNMPVTATWFSSMDLFSLKWQDTERKNYFTSRLSYVHQLMIARKFNDYLSIQLTPTFIHKNLVSSNTDDNDTYAMGLGGRFKLTQRVSLNAEYFYLLPGSVSESFINPLSIGFDIETGGHVFQLHFTNAQPMFERGFITETRGKWQNGDIYFGFNISRVFTLKKPAEFRE